MADTGTKTRSKLKTARPPLYKVMLLNDDFTPRDFVVQVLKAEFRMSEDQANGVMVTAHTSRLTAGSNASEANHAISASVIT